MLGDDRVGLRKHYKFVLTGTDSNFLLFHAVCRLPEREPLLHRPWLTRHSQWATKSSGARPGVQAFPTTLPRYAESWAQALASGAPILLCESLAEHQFQAVRRRRFHWSIPL